MISVTLSFLCMGIYIFIGIGGLIFIWSSLVMAKKSDIILGLDV